MPKKNKVLETALQYIDRGINVIPIRENDKKPAINEWKRWQDDRVTKGQAKKWWGEHPEWNIAMVCGAISGRFVVDIDSYKKTDTAKALETLLKKEGYKPFMKTPRGGHHYYFQFDTRLGNAKLDGVDIKSEGGYVLIPPSVVNGNKYEWIHRDQHNAVVSNSLLSFISSNRVIGIGEDTYRDLQEPTDITSKISEGMRDDKLFHYANEMAKGGTKANKLAEIITYLGLFACDPPFTKEEINIKIKSALQRTGNLQESISKAVQKWVSLTSGYFSVTDCYRDLQLLTKKDREAAFMALYRLAQDGVIEKHGQKRGVYRTPDRELIPLEWEDFEVEDAGIWLPFGLSKMIYIMPKNIILIAGVQNSGKTAVLMNILKYNLEIGKECVYFSSEMGPMEMKNRVAQFDKWPRKKFESYERSHNFGDVIRPNKINLIDYLEISDDFSSIAGQLTAIHDKLKKGVAVIALQKDPEKQVGRGASFSMEKPRLYLTIDQEDYGQRVMTIVKAKNYNTKYDDPNGLQIFFDIVNGGELEAAGSQNWHPSPAKKRAERRRRNERDESVF